MSASELIDAVSAYVSLAAVVSFLLLLPLYVSGRRDVRRMRAWMEREPDHPAEDIVASDAILDRAETELEELQTQLAPPAAVTPPGALPAATRVTTERPALSRITMERAALEPHPRWRQFTSRVTQPRVLIAIGVAALLLGVAAIFGSEQLLSDGDGERAARGGAIDPADVTVAVLNGTSVGGLAGKVASDVEVNGFRLGAVTNAMPGYERTVVLYANDQKRAAQKVGRDIGVEGVEPLDREIRQLAGEADVVVIAGEDRAQS